MRIETGNPSGVSDLQRRINEIAHLEELERAGIHVDSIAHEIDPTTNHSLSTEIDSTHQENTKPEPTFGQRNRAATRRRTRSISARLLKRRR